MISAFMSRPVTMKTFFVEGDAAFEPIGSRRGPGHDEDVANIVR